MPIGLTDSQLKIVMERARGLAIERRAEFLQRVGSMLRLRGRWFTDRDVNEVVSLAVVGLHHTAGTDAA